MPQNLNKTQDLTGAVRIDDNNGDLENVQHHKIDTSSSYNNAKKIALISSSIAALASGTPYLYGVYSPQLINRCGFSAIDSSYLSFSGNIGSSIGGFFAGLIIDKFGISSGILLGALLEFAGFFTFYLNYKYALHNFIHLVFAMICIGFGSVLAYFATIKVATLNFPNHRGFANACPVSSYGLAALFYAAISTIWFSDDIEGLLKFIALFSGLVIAISSFFIKIYENEHEDDDNNNDDDEQLNNILSDNESNSSDENEIEVGLKYLLKGHRGSFVQAENLLRNQSSSSLFSDISEASSLASTTPSSSRNSSIISYSQNSSLYNSQNPISINQSELLRSNSSNNSNIFSNLSGSPLDFKAKQSILRSGSFRINNSVSNSPRNGRLFGSVTQKHISNPISSRMTPTEESPMISENLNNTNNSISALSSSPNIAFVNSPKSTTDLKSMKQHSYNSTSNTIPVTESSFMDKSNNSNINDNAFNNSNNNNDNDNNNSSNNSNLNLTELINRNKSKRTKKKKKRLSPKEHVIKLLKDKLFLSEYILNAFYSSMGQVYIFSIGFIVRAQVNYYRIHNPSIMETSLIIKLATHFSKTSNPADLAVTYQALQVSIISFSNFLGRLVSGPASDLIHKKFKMNKLYVIIFSLLFLTLGQISLLISNNLDYLSFTSFLIGLSYGSIYGTMPSIVADTFGSKNFATTWALMGTGPIGIFLILSDYFGTVYDSNSEWSYLGDIKLKMCLKGKNCYWDVFALNTIGCFVLFIGYFWLVYTENKKGK